MKRWKILILLLFVLSGCQEANENRGKIAVQFTLPQSDGTLVTPNEILCYKLESSEAPTRLSVAPGLNEIWVDRNQSYLFGLVDSTGEVSELSRSFHRGLGNAISTLGSIRVVASDLETLPAGNGAADSLDYGELTQTDNAFESSIETVTLADQLELDPAFVEDLGSSDDLLRKVFNPDIDQDGVYDSEQNIKWNLSASLDFAMSYGNSDFDNGIIPYTPEDLAPIVTKYVFRAESGFPPLNTIPIDEIRLYLPEGHNAVWRSGTAVDYMMPNRYDQFEEWGDIWFPQDIVERPDTGYGDWLNGGIPFDGDYHLMLGVDNNYYINNVDFVKPSDNYENFIFPVFKLTLSGDRADVISWRWYVQQDGVFVAASPELVQAMIRDFTIGYGLAGGGPDDRSYEPAQDWFAGGSFNFSDASLSDTIDYSNFHIDLSFNDSSGNIYHWMQSKEGRGWHLP